jgi:hypothetical protein
MDSSCDPTAPPSLLLTLLKSLAGPLRVTATAVARKSDPQRRRSGPADGLRSLRKLTPDAKMIPLVRRGGVDAAAPLKPKSASPETVRRNLRVRVAPTRAAKTKTAKRKTKRIVPIAGTSARNRLLGSSLS